MSVMSPEELRDQKCQPCEGGVNPYQREDAEKQLERLEEWELSPDAKRIRRAWSVQDFAAGMKFLTDVAQIAEDEGHHPDLSLQNYREVTIELTTHAIDGLSTNDFIVAARIDAIAPAEKST